MSGMGGSLSNRKLRAPQVDGGALIDPPLGNVQRMIAQNASLRSGYGYDLQGRDFGDLAGDARRDLLTAAAAYTGQYQNVDPTILSATQTRPMLLSGHQPELFHAGVWFKNFVLSSLAENHHAAAVHLLIDNDVADPASIRVPGGSTSSPTVEAIAIDRPAGGAAYEERGIVDRETFASFAGRVAGRIEPLVANPLLGRLWPPAVEASQRHGNLGRSLAEARHRLEAAHGLRTLELPLSQACNQPAFYWFAAHLLAQLPRLRDVYNAALLEYRRQRRIRSRSHPVPELETDGDWLEAPFWIWSSADPRRRRLFARPVGQEIELTDRAELRARLSLSADSLGQRAVVQLGELAAAGIKLRPRALTTTMFARLLLSDLFLHGIGGAKYDELTDAIVERFFGFEPPAFATLSATVLLPIERSNVSLGDLRSAKNRLRDLRFNPERYLDLDLAENAEAQQLADEKRRWINTDLPRGGRLVRHRAIDGANRRLQHFAIELRRRQAARCEEIAAELRRMRLLGARDFSFCLFPEETLLPLLLELSLAKP